MKNNFSKQWDAGGGSRSIIQGLNLFTSRNLFKSLKSILMVVALLSLSINVWGAIANPYSFTFAKGDLTTSSTSYTSGEVTWSLSATENQWDGTKMGYIFGSAGTPKTLTISTDDISGTITNVSVTGRSNNSGKTATVSVMVGTTSFTTSDNSWDNGSNQTLQFSGSASGTIAVTITPDACGYGLLGISVTYSAGPTTYSVTYDKNGATSGSVPTDATAYTSGQSVTVLGNTGNLAKTGKKFNGWNSNTSGTGTNYAVGSTFNISANTTLYAKWDDITYTDLFLELKLPIFYGIFYVIFLAYVKQPLSMV